MHIGKTHNASYSMEISSSQGPFRELSVVDFEKDLGLWTTSTLKPSLHCEKTAVNATKFLGLLKRTFSVFSNDLFIFLYLCKTSFRICDRLCENLPLTHKNHF